MRILPAFILAVLLICRPAVAAEPATQPSTQPAVKIVPATITSVNVDPNDPKILLVRFDHAGKTFDHRVDFHEPIKDFRYCPWIYGQGIAIVARTVIGEESNYFYATIYCEENQSTHPAMKIHAPKGAYPVLGIANTGGDSIVVTAAKHQRNPKESVSGWVYIDNCPLTDVLAEKDYVIGTLIPFEALAENALPREK